MNLVTLAQQLGEQLANSSLTWQFLHTSNLDNYTTIQLTPYKHLEDSLTWWYGVLRSFIGSKAKVYCHITWNKHAISLWVSVPKYLLPTLESSLYTNISNIDIKQTHVPDLQWLRYLQAAGSAPQEVFLHDTDFKKDGTYLDPFMDIISLFDQITNNSLSIVVCIDFDHKESSLRKIWKSLVRYVRNPLMGTESKEDKDAKDTKNDTSHLMIKTSIGYRLQHYTPWLEVALQWAFSKYCKNGKLKWISTSTFLPLQLSQVINLFHLPSGKIIDNLTYLPYRKLQFPNNIPTLDNVTNKNDLTIIWKTDYKNQTITFGVTREDKLRHMYIIGKTWVGKSNLIANLARSDMISNKGLCVIDPHGDLIDDIIAQVPSYRINDVVLFDVADRERPVWFNVLEYDKPEEKTLIASGIVSIFKKLFGHSRWPRLEYILRNVLLSILEYPNATLMHVLRMLTDSNFREDVLEYVKDPVLLKFWRDEFDKRPDKQKEEAISPISNKVGQFTSSQIIRNIFWQSKSKINFRRLMDEWKIILINLSKWKIGEDSTNLLGSFVVSKIQIDAMSRADVDESRRKDFYLYIDEFQNFATESFATILSEARKYKLGLIVANQYSSQLDEVTRGAIFGNVGSIISMTLGYDDAVIMANQFKSMVSANDFLDIPKYKAYIKLMIHGIVSDPFTMQTIALPPWDDVVTLKEKIKQQSRNKYAISRTELEELIKIRAERSFSKTEKAVLKAKEEYRDKGIKEIDWEDWARDQKNEKKTEEKNSSSIQWGISYKKTGVISAATKVNESKNTISNQIDQKKSTPIDSSDLWKNSSELFPKKPITSQPKPINHNILPSNYNPTVFTKHAIHSIEPDQVLRDAIKKDHKIIFHQEPEWLKQVATIDSNKPKWWRYKKGKTKVYKVTVDMYAHNTLMSPDKAGVDIWVGTPEEVLQQVQHGFTNLEKRFLIDKGEAWSSRSSTEPQEKIKSESWVKDDPTAITEYAGIKVGKTYEWYVKLKYNYGLFVTVGDLDGLLHKKMIDSAEWVSWKKLYEIGDPITVKALEIKELDGRVTVVRTQL